MLEASIALNSYAGGTRGYENKGARLRVARRCTSPARTATRRLPFASVQRTVKQLLRSSACS